MDFEDFYRAERIAVVRLCYLVTLDAEAAADAAQEAMLRAFARWETLSGQSPDAWVRTVALNLCRSRWRRLQRDLPLAPRAFGVGPVPEVRDVDLLAALRDLPRRQREAVALRYWADFTVEECASMMGVTAGSVSQHLARARRALRASRALVTSEGSA